MPAQYTPLTQDELNLIKSPGHFSAPAWTGPALPRPEGSEGLEQIIDTVNKLLARAQYLIQAKDGLSILYTLKGVTATAERFMLGTQQQVQQAADLRGVLVLIEQFLSHCFPDPAHENRIQDVFKDMRADVEARALVPEVKPLAGFRPLEDVSGKASAVLAGIAHKADAPVSRLNEALAALTELGTDFETKIVTSEKSVAAAFAGATSMTTVTASVTTVSTSSSQTTTPPPAAAHATPDYSAFALEDPSQFSMAWTTFEDAFRKGYPHIAEYTAAITDPAEATRQFWPMLRSSALPYNLFVLHKLDTASAMAFRNKFGRRGCRATTNFWIPAGCTGST